MPNQPRRRFFSAVSLERAVLEGANYYGLAPDELGYQPVEKTHGFTNRRKVVIRVDPENPRVVESAPAEIAVDEEPETPAMEAASQEQVAENAMAEADVEESPPDGISEPEEPAEAASSVEASSVEVDDVTRDESEVESEGQLEPQPEQISEPPAPREVPGGMVALPSSAAELRQASAPPPEEILTSARNRLSSLLELGGLRLDVQIYEGEEGLEVDLSGEDGGLVVEDEGQVIRALEHLLPRLMQSDLGRIIPCRVDCQGFQSLREERLRLQAQTAARAVRESGQARTLEPMHPADRRIIHLTLVPDETVSTESSGRGYFRRVTVRSV